MTWRRWLAIRCSWWMRRRTTRTSMDSLTRMTQDIFDLLRCRYRDWPATVGRRYVSRRDRRVDNGSTWRGGDGSTRRDAALHAGCRCQRESGAAEREGICAGGGPGDLSGGDAAGRGEEDWRSTSSTAFRILAADCREVECALENLGERTSSRRRHRQCAGVANAYCLDSH